MEGDRRARVKTPRGKSPRIGNVGWGIMMYKIENTAYGLKLTFSGVIKKEEMVQWAGELRIACGRAGSSFGVLIDMRDIKPLAPDVQEEMVKAQAFIKAAGLKRSCVILGSKILAMQFERLAKESGVFSYERYVDVGSNPDSETVALDWVVKGADAIRR